MYGSPPVGRAGLKSSLGDEEEVRPSVLSVFAFFGSNQVPSHTPRTLACTLVLVGVLLFVLCARVSRTRRRGLPSASIEWCFCLFCSLSLTRTSPDVRSLAFSYTSRTFSVVCPVQLSLAWRRLPTASFVLLSYRKLLLYGVSSVPSLFGVCSVISGIPVQLSQTTSVSSLPSLFGVCFADSLFSYRSLPPLVFRVARLLLSSFIRCLLLRFPDCLFCIRACFCAVAMCVCVCVCVMCACLCVCVCALPFACRLC
jgi:hypothetical protein